MNICRESRVESREPKSCSRRSSLDLRLLQAFTLVEIMIVAGLIAILAAVGIPSVISMMNKEGMRKATSDVIEGCSFTRAAAIFSGQTAELVIHPHEGTFSISANGGNTADYRMDWTGTLPASVKLELLGVNFIELQDAEVVRVKFYPNGTSDECAIILRSDQQEVRKITLDVVTGLADMEVVR
jgi:prepilin-type N-terminal cleavage/methylation domain-containing protein